MRVILKIELTNESSEIIFRELYECLRQAIEAIGYRRGYKFENHESIKSFVFEMLGNKSLANDFDRYRKIRHGINYYGETVSVETTAKAIEDIPRYIKEISLK